MEDSISIIIIIANSNRVVGGAPIAQYGRFGARGEVVSQRFRTGVKINKPGLEMQAALPFFVPYIIKTIVGDIYR